MIESGHIGFKFYVLTRVTVDCLCVLACDARCSETRNIGGTFYTCAQDGRTALIEADKMGHADCVRLLLDAGADKNAANNVRAGVCFHDFVCSCMECVLICFQVISPHQFWFGRASHDSVRYSP